MKYYDKSITFYNENRSSVSVDVDMKTRLTPKVKSKLLSEYAPNAVEITVFTHWNNGDEFLRASFRSGMNYITYKKNENGDWYESKRGTYTNR